MLLSQSEQKFGLTTALVVKFLVSFTVQCVDSFGRLSQRDHAMWLNARLELLK